VLSILGITIALEEVSAKFKYGGNVDEAHRLAVVDHLRQRNGPGDTAAAGHVLRRLGPGRGEGDAGAEGADAPPAGVRP
jgi:transcriptional regulator